MRAIIAAVLLLASVSAVQRPLERAEEVDAIKQAVANRVANHFGADNTKSIAAALRGEKPAQDTYQSNFDLLKEDNPILNKVISRINHPNYPYPGAGKK